MARGSLQSTKLMAKKSRVACYIEVYAIPLLPKMGMVYCTPNTAHGMSHIYLARPSNLNCSVFSFFRDDTHVIPSE